jgi:hypothetical protein
LDKWILENVIKNLKNPPPLIPPPTASQARLEGVGFAYRKNALLRWRRLVLILLPVLSKNYYSTMLEGVS